MTQPSSTHRPAPEVEPPDLVADGDDAEIVDALVALGVSEEQAQDAVQRDRVPLLLARQLLGEDRPYTLEEVAHKGGIDEDVLRRVFRALGMPLRDYYGDSDVAEAKQLAGVLDTLSEDTLIRLARVRGLTVSRIAMGDADAIRDELIAPMRQSGADDLAVAVALAEAAETLMPVSVNLLEHAYRRAMLDVLSGEVATAVAREATQEVPLAVGFCDLVGYTALSARIDPLGLDAVLDAFEERVLEVAGSADDVDVVKFLGDAVMLVAVSPTRLGSTLLELVEPVETLEETPLRAGLAAGPTLTREGDYFGPVVNLAARLTDRARPWSLLADDDLADDLAETFEVSRIRPIRVRGVGFQRPIAVTARRSEPGSDDG